MTPNTTPRWAILRTSGARTLPLVKSLATAGLEAWSPRQIIFRRRPRSNRTDELEVPIAPTFVFLRADQIDIVMGCLAPGRVNPHPPFSILHDHRHRAPLVSDAGLAGLQEEEAAMMEAARISRQVLDNERRRAEDKRRRAVRKEQLRQGRRPPRNLKQGDRVVIQDSAWTGMTGIVLSTDGRTARVNFGASISVEVDAWLLLTAEVMAA